MKIFHNLLLLVIVFALFLTCGQSSKEKATTAEGFQLPEYEKVVLKNGLTLFLMEQHEVPLIYASMVFPAGAVKDGSKSGLASLTADALLFDTKNYSKNEIEETLDFLGASYGTSASAEVASVTMSFVNKDWNEALPILKDIVVNPKFNKSEFEKRKKRLMVQLELAKERPSDVIGDYFNKFLFKDHPYGNPESGTKLSISNITINNVEAFYEANYRPEESALALVGDFKTSTLKKEIENLFKDWQAPGASQKVEAAKIPSYDRSRILLVNKDDATETQFRIGGFGVKRSNPDYVPIQVVNTILGGRFTSWLNDELRVNAGLTYGARSYFSMYKNSGTFAMSSFTRTEKTIEALDLALEVYNRLFTQGIDETTLTSAKNYVKGQYPPRYETGGSLASLLTAMFIYDFDESFINDFEKNVDGLTVDKTKEIIEKYFPNENLQFVLIGKASEIREKVSKYGEITEKEIRADGF